MAAPTMIDPTKQAEYPIVLGERLATTNSSRLVNVNYNYKTKAATSHQRSTITRSSRSRDLYDLSVTDKAPSADHTLTYSYQGSEDPANECGLVLVFDSDRKVFVLEPVSTKLNFNLRSAPGKTEKQVLEQYEPLRIVQEDRASSDDRNVASTEYEGPADDSNPYDFRHFLPKEGAEDVKPVSGHTTPDPANISKASPPVMPATKSAAKPDSRPKTESNKPRETKRPTKPSASANPPNPRADPPEHGALRDSLSDADPGTGSQQSAQSPNSNIIVDGDLIIDMGSPPSRPAFKVNPTYFSSNGTPTDERDDEAGDEEMEGFRLPSPAGDTNSAPAPAGEHLEDDDALAAEMEAAFEESAREEEARSQQYDQPTSRQYNVASDDESEVSEEE